MTRTLERSAYSSAYSSASSLAGRGRRSARRAWWRARRSAVVLGHRGADARMPCMATQTSFLSCQRHHRPAPRQGHAHAAAVIRERT